MLCSESDIVDVSQADFLAFLLCFGGEISTCNGMLLKTGPRKV